MEASKESFEVEELFPRESPVSDVGPWDLRGLDAYGGAEWEKTLRAIFTLLSLLGTDGIYSRGFDAR